MKFVTNLLMMACLFMATNIMAGPMRMAEGKPCYPTEKTYYEEDGVTPFSCEPAGGPAYVFKVYNGKDLLWEGKLVATEPEVYFKLPANTDTERKTRPTLIIKRELNVDPTGHVVFFGEEHLLAIAQLTDGKSSIATPEISATGKLVKISEKSGNQIVQIGALPNSIVSHDYKLVIGLDLSNLRDK